MMENPERAILNSVRIPYGGAMHRTQDTYALSHFRQHTGEHLERFREGRVETIT